MRTIRIKTTMATAPVSIETAATTFGEFKKEPSVQALGINWSSSKVITKETRVSLELDESVLPADTFLFVYPTKTKSGADYSSMSFSELRKLCASTLPKGTISANPSKIEMITALKKANKSATTKLTNTETSTVRGTSKEVTVTNSTPVQETPKPNTPSVVVYQEAVTEETLKKDYSNIHNKISSKPYTKVI